MLAVIIVYGARSASSRPLYELSHPIGHFHESNATMSFSRFEYRVVDQSNFSPRSRPGRRWGPLTSAPDL